jgi:hypothetical protein
MMFSYNIVDVVPLWILTLLTALLILVSVEIGWRIGNYARKYHSIEADSPISAGVGAMLGLLAFLLAFTFGMAGNRFETRKGIVLQEANSIGTTYLRTDFLAPEIRDEARQLLREYAILRTGGMSAIMSVEGRAKSSAILNRLWEISAPEAAQNDSITAGLYIQSLNETIDLDTSRATAYRNRIPDPIWIMLCLVSIFSMMALGFQFGLTGTRSWTVMILIIVAFTVVIVLIADLDHPQAGFIQVSQQPLIDLINQMPAPAP